MKLIGQVILAMSAGAVLGAVGFNGWQVLGICIAMTLWDWSTQRG